MTFNYVMVFRARLIGAIGLVQDVEVTLGSREQLTNKEIVRMIYGTYEHVQGLKINGQEAW